MNQQDGRHGSGNHPMRTAKRKKNFKNEDSKGPLGYEAYQHSHRCIPEGEEREKWTET